MHSAATDGIDGSPGAGWIAFEASCRIFPGVSEPSRVVRSQHRNARSSAHIFESFLIDRLASEAARSLAPTASTEPPMRSTSSSGCCATVATDGPLPCCWSVCEAVGSPASGSEMRFLDFGFGWTRLTSSLARRSYAWATARVRSLQHDRRTLVGELQQRRDRAGSGPEAALRALSASDSPPPLPKMLVALAVVAR